MDYCGECDHWPEQCHLISNGYWCNPGQIPMGKNLPACRKFSAKKRTCGECAYPYWRTLDGFGICTVCSSHSYYCPIGKDSEICDNFKGEATRKTCGGTAERGM